MADFGRGIKAGIITGAIYLAISLILVFTLADYQYAPDFWDAAGLAYLPLGTQIIRGIIFGAVFATLYRSLPGKTSIEKGVVLSAFFWILTVIEVTYTNLSWPWQTAGSLDIGTLYGGTINLSSVSLALISVMFALVFGVMTGFFWNRLRGKGSAEERKGRPVLLISFILGAIMWAVVGATYIRFVVIALPFPRALFFSWHSILRTLVLFVGLLGWIFALNAWRKTRRSESGFRLGLAGGVIMVLTGFMLLPGALAITGGAFSHRKTAGEPGAAEVIARGKVAREQKTRTGIRRDLILVIISAVMLAVIIIVRFTMPTPTGTYTPITLDRYSSAAISGYGLSLTISLNSTTYHPGEQISVSIEEKNILPTENRVRSANRWPFHGLTLTPCGTLYYPFGISILQGYYDSENVTGAIPLQLFDPNINYTCPAILSAVSYDFQPWSDSADIYTDYGLMPWSRNMITEVTSDGFWTGSYPNATFNNFTPGTYTIVGGDEWGTLVILHCTVS